MIPASILEPLNKDGGALNVSATWFTPDRMHVIRQAPTHEPVLDARESEFMNSLLGVVDLVEQHESIVAVLEKRSR